MSSATMQPPNNRESNSERERQKLYKNSANKSEDLRRRRAENSVELRRQRRDDDLMKRRRQVGHDEDENAVMGIGSPQTMESEVMDAGEVTSPQKSASSSTTQQPASRLSIEEIITLLQLVSPSIEQLRIAFEGIRRLLSASDRDPPLEAVISAGLVPALIRALSIADEKVQLEAAWALTNVLSGTSEQTRLVINAGCVEPLMELCRNSGSSTNVVEQALWALTNIIGEANEYRDLVVKLGIVDILAKLMERVDEFPNSMVRTLAWTYSNLVRHKKYQLPFELLAKLVPGICRLLEHKDIATRQDACWGLSYLTDGGDENLQLALDCGVIPNVVKMLASADDRCVSPAIRVLGNFSAGSDELTQVVIETGVLADVFPSLFQRGKPTIVKEACWLLSNVLAGSVGQIQAVIDAKLLKWLFDMLKMGDGRVKLETSWAVSNFFNTAKASQILNVVKSEVEAVESICYALSIPDNVVIYNTLQALYKLLITVANSHPKLLSSLKSRVEEAEALDHLESLQHHENEEIYKEAYNIVEQFFSEDDDEEEEDYQNAQHDGAGAISKEENAGQSMFQF